MAAKLKLSMTVAGFAAPTVDQTPDEMKNRYYYHWLLDTDNNPATITFTADGTTERAGTWELEVEVKWRWGHARKARRAPGVAGGESQCINQIVAVRLPWPSRHRRDVSTSAWRCGLS